MTREQETTRGYLSDRLPPQNPAGGNFPPTRLANRGFALARSSLTAAKFPVLFEPLSSGVLSPPPNEVYLRAGLEQCCHHLRVCLNCTDRQMKRCATWAGNVVRPNHFSFAAKSDVHPLRLSVFPSFRLFVFSSFRNRLLSCGRGSLPLVEVEFRVLP